MDAALARWGAAGKAVCENASLSPGGFKRSPLIRAHCSDCHARYGRDLKYFCYPNASIIARSRFHGLSELQGQQIASYIRSLSAPSPGRPWNPPYQPGPGLDSQPAANWAAGADLPWVLDDDARTLSFLFASKTDRLRPSDPAAGKDLNWIALVPQITPERFRPDGNLNVREIPIAFQLPDWNHWLPQVHPTDAWGAAFQRSEFADWYAADSGSPAPQKSSGASKPSLRSLLESPDLRTLISSGRIAAYFDKWREARRVFLKPYVEGKFVNWALDLSTGPRTVWRGRRAAHLVQHHAGSCRARDSQHSRWPVRHGRQRFDQRVFQRLLV